MSVMLSDAIFHFHDSQKKSVSCASSIQGKFAFISFLLSSFICESSAAAPGDRGAMPV